MNPRIPEIVKNLANLIQELDNAQENRESLEVLGRIKLYSAQLYLETDMEIISLNREDLDDDVDFEDDEFSTSAFASPEKTEELIGHGEIPLEIVMPVSEDEEILEEFEIEEMSSAEFEFEEEVEDQEEETSEEFEIESTGSESVVVEEFDYLDEEESLDDQIEVEFYNMEESESEEFELEELQKPEEIQTPAELVFPTSSNEITSHSENTVENDLRNSQQNLPSQPQLFAHTNDLEAYKTKAQEILGMFSLSRRFEFANLLFAGDMQQFTLFLCEVLAAQNSDDREDIIDKWYEQNQWRRKDETASDLKRNLRKML